MIKTTIGIELDYENLEKIIEESLNIDSKNKSSVQVRCFPREENLVIFVEHPEDVISHPGRLFRLVRSVIEEKKVLGKVSIYLVVRGTSEPYLSDEISLLQAKNTLAIINSSEMETQSSLQLKSTENNPKLAPKNLPYPLISLGVGLGLMVVFSFVYFFSKPCVIGKCSLLTENQNLVDQSLVFLSPENDPLDLEKTKQKLKDAITNLGTIPSWSKYHPQANQLIQEYQTELKKIDQYLGLIKIEKKANYFTKKEDLTLEQLQNLAKSWEEAINFLQKLENTSQDQFFINKEKEYKTKLIIVQEKIAKQEEVNQYLLKAKNAINLAETRQKEVNSLANLQLVEATWKTAIERLEQIPSDSNLYREKQDLLESSLTKFTETQKLRKEQEKGLELYNKALNESKQADKLQRENQWSKAVNSWRNALNLLKQIPEGNFQYEQGKKLIATYEQSLQKAQQQLQKAISKQNIEQDLQSICSNTVPVCTYSVNNQQIKVVLTNSYLQRVKELSALLNTGDSQRDNNLIKTHIHQVENNLKYLNLKYKIPLEVYNPEGNLITKYQ
jgi:hypothetical protein